MAQFKVPTVTKVGPGRFLVRNPRVNGKTKRIIVDVDREIRKLSR